MNTSRHVIALGVLAAATSIVGAAHAQAAIDAVSAAGTGHHQPAAGGSASQPARDDAQRRFVRAASALARQDYEAAATDIREAASFLRGEADRATGDAKQELESVVAQLDRLAASVENGAVQNERTMAAAFARAQHALALEHRSRAAGMWARREYVQAGNELVAAAQALESAQGWIGGKAASGAAASVAATRALGHALASGGAWTRNEVGKSFESLGESINALGKSIAGAKQASPIDVGS
jgi:hypothetical protein